MTWVGMKTELNVHRLSTVLHFRCNTVTESEKHVIIININIIRKFQLKVKHWILKDEEFWFLVIISETFPSSRIELGDLFHGFKFKAIVYV